LRRLAALLLLLLSACAAPRARQKMSFDELYAGSAPAPAGPERAAASRVVSGKMPQARISDLCVCVGPPDSIAMGSATVLAAGMPAARMGDSSAHGGTIVIGCPTVLIGG